jgi:hypothetical protein
MLVQVKAGEGKGSAALFRCTQRHDRVSAVWDYNLSLCMLLQVLTKHGSALERSTIRGSAIRTMHAAADGPIGEEFVAI